MAVTNQERMGKAMELLCAGLAPFGDERNSTCDPWLAQ
jgi:hypothetical protein